jgi:hypothetical protein
MRPEQRASAHARHRESAPEVRPGAAFFRAEVEAERPVALLRMAIAATLALIFALAVPRNAPADQPVLVRQWLFVGRGDPAPAAPGVVGCFTALPP